MSDTHWKNHVPGPTSDTLSKPAESTSLSPIAFDSVLDTTRTGGIFIAEY